MADFTLATDLDGTLLEGSSESRALLAAALTEARTVFVTGRAVENVRPLLLDSAIPKPAYIIADVGATVVEASTLRSIQPLQAKIDSVWPGAHRVRAMLSRFEQIVPQDVPQERRCSYHIEDASAVTPELELAIREMGCDLLVSSGRYLDVLPRGVSKGSTLASLLDLLGIDRNVVLVAGDTLNDLSMFLLGLSGVVVRNAEEELIERLKGRAGIYFSRGEGASGILEALTATGLVKQARVARPSSRSVGVRQLVMVYHRLPTDRTRSPNGIIPSLLGFFADGRSGAWIGWSVEDGKPIDERLPVSTDYPNLIASPIRLTQADVERFYQRFSKEALWPVIFSFPSRVDFQQSDWEHYVMINRLFAERAAKEAELDALIWIHDYNLWMVPHFLRVLRPDLRIAFFHHTAFPPADIFNMLPWRQQIVGSLLSCDYIGFHIPRYAVNFVEVVSSNAPIKIVSGAPSAPRFMAFGCALGCESMATEIEVGGRRVGVGAHPVGIDVDLIRTLLERPEIQARAREIRDQLRGRIAILSIERLDYVKGPLQKVEAYERLLEVHPELQGNVVFLNVVTPPSAGMKIHQILGDQVDQAIGRVNGRFGRMDWTPIRYFLRALPFEEVVAHYAASDIAWITPLRDGLNLVAKEYVAAKAASGSDGVLILSEFAGAAVELHGALLTNPYDASSMVESLFHALTMDPEERRERQRRLARIVEHNDVRHWGDEFLKAAFRGQKTSEWKA